MMKLILIALFGLAGALALSECEKTRNNALSSGLIGAFTPTCEEDGSYTAFQCREAVCYCADPMTGKAIGQTQGHISDYDEIRQQCLSGSFKGLALASKRSQSACEKEYEKKKKLMGALRPICDEETGAYKIQCHEAFCYCADPLSGEPDYNFMMGNSHLKELEKACVDRLTRCRKQRYDAAYQPKIVGQSVPECDEQGLFKKAQCRESTCYCADELSGRPIPGSATHVSNHRAERCEKTECLAQTEEHNVPGKWKPRCDPDRGNFLPVQCRESECFCVDRISGEKIGKTVPVSQLDTLHKNCMTDCERQRDLGQKPYILYSLYTDKPRCEANGEYHNVQCKETECSCVDEHGQLNSRPKPKEKLNQLERQCRGGITECKNRRNALRWNGCPDECSQYRGNGEALVVCCCD